MAEYTINAPTLTAERLAAAHAALTNKLQGNSSVQVTWAEIRQSLPIPDAIASELEASRGVVDISEAVDSTQRVECRLTNNGSEITKDIPGTGGTLGIIVEGTLKCLLQVLEDEQKVVLKEFVGLRVDLPGFINPKIKSAVANVAEQKIVVTV